MANPQAYLTKIGFGKESTWGTNVARSLFVPITEPRFNPKSYRHVLDQGMRGVGADEFDIIPGVGQADGQFGGSMYLDPFGLLLTTILGADTYAASTHTIAQDANPPSLTLEWSSEVATYLIGGFRQSALTINFNGNDGTLTYQSQGIGKIGATGSATVTPTWPSVPPLAGWMGSLTIGGAAANVLIEGSLTINRKLRVLHGLKNAAGGVQDLVSLYPGVISMTGRLIFEFASTAEYDYVAAATTNVVVLTFQKDSTHNMAITMSKLAWRLGELEISDNAYQCVAQVNALYNVTDSGVCKVSMKNDIAVGY